MNKGLSAILKELLAYFGDEYYRNWLYDNREQYIRAYDCFEIVTCLPIDLKKKLEYIERIRPFLIDRNDEEVTATIKAYELGLELLNEEGPDILFQVTERGRYTLNGIEFYEDHTWPCRSYEQLVQFHENGFAEGVDYKSIKYDDFWYVIERYRLVDNEYKYEADYVISGNLDVINVYYHWENDRSECVLDVESQTWYRPDMGRLFLPMPYKEGDILTVDCQPFHRPHHAVVIYTHDNNLDCCTPGCLHYMEDGFMHGEHRRWVDCHSIKHYYCGQEELSPLINVGLYEGELPEDEALIGAVSNYIKTHENGAREIDEFRDKEDEEKLWEFISK